MFEKLKKEIKILKIYLLCSSIAFILIFSLAAISIANKTKFEEIDVERINVVEKNGQLRLVIANRERSPCPIIGGYYVKSREGQRPGMIFYNDNGDECGGMTWSSELENGKVRANAGLMFDQYNQDQTVGLTYSQSGNERTSGLMVWERPLTPLADFARELDKIEQLPEGQERNEALKKLRTKALGSGIAGVARVFVGRSVKNEAIVKLLDTKGRERILLYVDAENNCRLEFLNEKGSPILRLPDDLLKKE